MAMARRLKLIVAYDGTEFAGWQSQSHGNTIQDHLEGAFERVAGKPVRVHGAGRTDAGVHALAQVAGTVHGNGLADNLYGGPGMDWYFAGMMDVMFNKTTGEVVTPI